ncbi:cyclase family protein [Streptacidiphilus sp. PB12-B1b]|uniref:cyclase family protein n=1 Tax=Streptacidiphilus sp. PB12-B1b TaxID=2705012 RepID=UPI0015F8FCCD|nr:cyclase family protein [Streptacidiphilus sp. PB12-B1b]QMU79090.1 cyclase family protein [Streptacidiphilus sp. PB12-B1b]
MPRTVDLSRPLETGMPHARGVPAPEFKPTSTWAEHRMRVMRLDMPTHIGTHVDAPSHFVEDGATVDQLPLSALVGRAYCVQVLRDGPDAITAAELKAAVEESGAVLEPGDALLIRTGWDDRYTDPAYVDLHPYLAVDAAEWVVATGLRLVGMDTISPDLPMALRPEDFPYDVHRALLGGGLPILENLVLREVPDQWCTLFVGVLNVLGGDGAPARALAVLD